VRDRVLTGGMGVKAGEDIGEGRWRQDITLGRRYLCVCFFLIIRVAGLPRHRDRQSQAREVPQCTAGYLRLVGLVACTEKRVNASNGLINRGARKAAGTLVLHNCVSDRFWRHLGRLIY